MKITITDIAKDTGLSLSTISKYLNHKSVLPENRVLIEASIKKLGYTPNKIAQGLRSKKTQTIALLIPSFSNYFWGAAVTCIETALREHGYKSIVFSCPPDPQQQSHIVDLIMGNHVDGIIAIVPYIVGDSFTTLCSGSIPVVLLDQVMDSLSADYVTSDNYEGGYLAGQYFARRHHTRIGFVAGRAHTYTIEMRIRGFLNALRDAGIFPPAEYYSYETSACPTGKEQVEQLLKLSVPPTALFFCSYELCYDGVTALLDAGYKIPEDFSVITFDDDTLFSTVSPRITVIRQNFEEIGKQAARLLLQRMQNDKTDFPGRILVPVSLIERSSVKTL